MACYVASILNSLTKTHCPNGLKCENRCGVSTCPRSTQPPYQYTYFQPSPRIVCFDSQCRSLAHIQVSKSRDHEAPPAQSCDLSIQYHAYTPYLRHRPAGHPNKETNKQPKRGNTETKGRPRLRPEHDALTEKSCCTLPRSHQCAR